MIPYAVPLNGKAAAVAPQPLAVWNFKDGPTPNMTNSGGANGTCFGPDGLLTHVGTTNLLLHSEDFTNVVWGFSGVNFTTANYGNDPIGGATADRVVTDGFSGDYLYQDYTPGGAIPQVPFTFSCWVRGRTGNGRLTINESGGATGARTVADGEAFDLDGGIRRYSVTITPNAADRTTLQVRFQSFSATVVDIDVWGAQLEQNVPSNGQGVYTPTTTAAATSGGLRFDHDPASGVARGLLVEEARTNVCLQSEDFDTTWAKTGAAVTTNSTVAPDGTATADTITDDDAGGIEFIKQDITVANDTTTYAYSIFVKKTTSATVWPGFGLVFSGGVTARRSEFHLNTNTGVLYARTGIAGQTDAGKGVVDCGDYWRIYILCQNTGDGHTTLTAYVFPSVTTNSADSAWSNNTGSVICWGAQVEAGAFSTSYIKTTTAAVARTADVVTAATSAIPGFSSSALTVMVEYWDDVKALGQNAGIFSLSDGTLNNRIGVFKDSTGSRALRVVSAAAATVSTSDNQANYSAGYHKMAVASTANDFAYCRAGTIAVTDSSVTMPTVTTLKIGTDGAGASFANGHIARIAYWPERLSDDVLRGLTK